MPEITFKKEKSDYPLHPDQHATTIEKIVLCTTHINIMAQGIHGVKRDMETSIPLIKDPNIVSVPINLAKKHEDVLNGLLSSLDKIREGIADYLNNNDAVTHNDVKFGNTIHEIINNIR